jgi:hypothetical protein
LKSGLHTTTIQFPTTLHDRARLVGKRFGKKVSEIIRDGLNEQVEILEARWIELENKKRRKTDTAQENRLAQRITSSELAPKPLRSLGGDSAPVDDNKVETICNKHAKGIAEKLHMPMEKRLLTQTAIADVKREMPLTHPSDAEIIVILEKAVVRVRATMKEEEVAELPPVVEEVINTSKIRSLGDA